MHLEVKNLQTKSIQDLNSLQEEDRTKLIVFLDNVFFDEKKITNSDEVAKLVKNHLSHLGKVNVRVSY